ncbi:MAG: hypothetical protein J0H68_09440 [Sphingobacteriia bacterium]|nr:hypothetical protein [Sphingobacteriia bacterium]
MENTIEDSMNRLVALIKTNIELLNEQTDLIKELKNYLSHNRLENDVYNENR